MRWFYLKCVGSLMGYSNDVRCEMVLREAAMTDGHYRRSYEISNAMQLVRDCKVARESDDLMLVMLE